MWERCPAFGEREAVPAMKKTPEICAKGVFFTVAVR
jgi:hypothetical protein